MGEASALAAALFWALSGILLASQAGRRSPLALSALRGLSASALLALVFVLPLGTMADLRQMSANTGLSMVGSGVVGMGLGDTMYIASLGLIGVARTFPIATAAYPLLTFLLAASVLGEGVTGIVVLGAALIVVGISLLVTERATVAPVPVGAELGAAGWGVLLALGAAAAWALATIWLRAGSGDLGAVGAASLRIPAASLFVLGLVSLQSRRFEVTQYNRRSLATVVVAGILGTGLGGLLFIFAVQEVGAGKSAILSSTAPLFALPLSALLLAERITPRVVLATVVSIAGIWLVV